MIADGAHLRAARGALGWSQAQLAEAAAVSRPKVDRLKREAQNFAKAGSRTLRALEQALLMRGIEMQLTADGTPRCSVALGADGLITAPLANISR